MSDFTPLTPQWEAWRDQGLSLAARICGRDSLPPVEDLDAIYQWCLQQDFPEEGLIERPHVLALGMGLGEHLARRHGMEWGLGHDGDQRAVGLHHPPTGARVWPMAMILRRLTERAETTMQGIIGGATKALDDLPRA